MSEPGSHVSDLECMAMRALTLDGWTRAEIALAFERSKKTVIDHVNGPCNHKSEGDKRSYDILCDVDPDGEVNIA